MHVLYVQSVERSMILYVRSIIFSSYGTVHPISIHDSSLLTCHCELNFTHHVYIIDRLSLIISGIAEWSDPIKWLENDTGTNMLNYNLRVVSCI